MRTALAPPADRVVKEAAGKKARAPNSSRDSTASSRPVSRRLAAVTPLAPAMVVCAVWSLGWDGRLQVVEVKEEGGSSWVMLPFNRCLGLGGALWFD